MTSRTDILLCCDLDRTILPNGHQDEWPGSRRVLHAVVDRPEINLVYVSGRDKSLMHEAVRDYEIPLPDRAVGDVGTTIYEITDNDWVAWESWYAEIGKDWRGFRAEDLDGFLKDLDALWLQEPEKQNRYKLSYYTDPTVDHRRLIERIRQRLSGRNIRSRAIWSLDEQRDLGLLDVLPQSASKLHAIRYVMDRCGYTQSRVVFCGDSGNDLNVLTSDLQAVLVKNAAADVCRAARKAAIEKGRRKTLYIARGDFLGMNGNYAAGVLEGLAHFIPRTRDWIAAAVARERSAG
jgi:hypothetical protein